MAAARRRQELEKPIHVGPVHAWELLDVWRPSVQHVMASNVQEPGSWLKQWQKSHFLSKGCEATGYSAPHKHLLPAPAIWSQGTGPMRVFQQATQEDHAVKEQVVVAQQQQQEQEAMDMDADDAMLFESLLQDPEGAS